MEEDKSAGMYIKTENWRGDDELDNRHGYRKGRDGDIHNRRTGSRSKVPGSRDYKNKRDYNKGPSTGSGTAARSGTPNRSDYKKNGHNDYKKNNRKPYIDPAKLAGLSYEERMKMYKDAYGKKDGYKNGPSRASGTPNRYDNRQQNKPAPKKTFWQKVKSFFGR